MTYPVIIKNSMRAKRLTLRLDMMNRHILITKPSSYKESLVYNFIDSHKKWIDEKFKAHTPPVCLTFGSIIPVLGHNRVIQQTNKPSYLTDDTLYINSEINFVNLKVRVFLAHHLQSIILPLCKEKSLKLGVPYRKITIKDTKSQWGSCSSDQNLSFCYKLIFCPFFAIDYIVAHEVAHLKIKDHSARFKALNKELAVDYESGKIWLKENGRQIMTVYFFS